MRVIKGVLIDISRAESIRVRIATIKDAWNVEHEIHYLEDKFEHLTIQSQVEVGVDEGTPLRARYIKVIRPPSSDQQRHSAKERGVRKSGESTCTCFWTISNCTFLILGIFVFMFLFAEGGGLIESIGSGILLYCILHGLKWRIDQKVPRITRMSWEGDGYRVDYSDGRQEKIERVQSEVGFTSCPKCRTQIPFSETKFARCSVCGHLIN
ncbi:MAG: hypothetical protein ACW98Y_13670, partial [Candidatus Thorarchaeota archaeon]